MAGLVDNGSTRPPKHAASGLGYDRVATGSMSGNTILATPHLGRRRVISGQVICVSGRPGARELSQAPINICDQLSSELFYYAYHHDSEDF